MKKTLFRKPLALISIILFAFAIVSCSSDGADGADGAEGPKGADGAAGPAGPAGPKGDAGSGSIIYSEWLDVAFKADTVNLAGGGVDTIGYYATVNAPKLTLDMINKADVKMFLNVSDKSDPTVYPLPYSNPRSGVYIEVISYEQNIQLYSNIEMSTYSRNGQKYQQYRYMIIPGSVTARQHSKVDWSNYAQAKKQLGFED